MWCRKKANYYLAKPFRLLVKNQIKFLTVISVFHCLVLFSSFVSINHVCITARLLEFEEIIVFEEAKKVKSGNW